MWKNAGTTIITYSRSCNIFYSTVEKALAGRKKSFREPYVVQVWSSSWLSEENHSIVTSLLHNCVDISERQSTKPFKHLFEKTSPDQAQVIFDRTGIILQAKWASPGKMGMCTPLEIGAKDQKFLENLKWEAYFQLIGVILALTVYLPVWHSHCTRARFTILASCNDEFAFQSCPLFFYRGRLRNWQANCFIVVV